MSTAEVEASRKSGSSRLMSGLAIMREQAEKEGFQIGKELGYQEGLEVGAGQGKEEFEQTHRQLLDDFKTGLEELVRQIERSLEEYYLRAEERLATLAIQIANRAICQELSLSRDAILKITQEAIAEVRHGEEVVVRVNPLDVGLLHAHRDDILKAVSSVRKVEVVGDSSIRSGCEVVSKGGVVDARIDTYLARLEQEAA
ncbi:MAG: hypothetical protein KIT11_02790 [Fimbriimonadaceae bacterium]|nr:hypothetical protein [Fimbriimonadaceae bacterium]QYK54704.1 MAG: hypothetical protein KF733_06735 [Fimbriimonadaceae bacterium]